MPRVKIVSFSAGTSMFFQNKIGREYNVYSRTETTFRPIARRYRDDRYDLAKRDCEVIGPIITAKTRRAALERLQREDGAK